MFATLGERDYKILLRMQYVLATKVQGLTFTLFILLTIPFVPNYIDLYRKVGRVAYVALFSVLIELETTLAYNATEYTNYHSLTRK